MFFFRTWGVYEDLKFLLTIGVNLLFPLSIQDFNQVVQMHSSLVRRLSLERELEVTLSELIFRLRNFTLDTRFSYLNFVLVKMMLMFVVSKLNYKNR